MVPERRNAEIWLWSRQLCGYVPPVMAASTEQLIPVCELLLGAAFADNEFVDRERAAIESLLTQLLEDIEIPVMLEACIENFEAENFDLAKSCASFKKDPAIEPREMLELIAAVHDADDEYDLAEDDYIRKVAAELGVADDKLEGLVVSYELAPISAKIKAAATPPPPPPK